MSNKQTAKFLSENAGGFVSVRWDELADDM